MPVETALEIIVGVSIGVIFVMFLRGMSTLHASSDAAPASLPKCSTCGKPDLRARYCPRCGVDREPVCAEPEWIEDIAGSSITVEPGKPARMTRQYVAREFIEPVPWTTAKWGERVARSAPALPPKR